MPIDVTKLIAGPADLYVFTVGLTEPSTPVAFTPPAGWRNLGGTNDGVNVTIGQTYEAVTSDQTTDVIASLPTERNVTVETNLMERTMDNLKVSLNGGTIVTGGTVDTFEPITDRVANPPTYTGVGLYGKSAINGKAGLLIVRRCLVTDDVSFSYQKGAAQMLAVTWTAHYVSGTVSPWIFLQEH
jgi:hypothetical protein